jgi:hypothetical protein
MEKLGCRGQSATRLAPSRLIDWHYVGTCACDAIAAWPHGNLRPLVVGGTLSSLIVSL